MRNDISSENQAKAVQCRDKRCTWGKKKRKKEKTTELIIKTLDSGLVHM